MKGRLYIVIGSFSGAVAVMLGALGAHALKAKLSENLLDSFLTGNRYHIIHSFLLVVIGILLKSHSSKWLNMSALLIALGTLLFSFSIYILATSSLWTNISFKWLGPITPIGGLLLIIGWIIMGISFLKTPQNT